MEKHIAIKVKYTNVDGLHMFVSDSAKTKGLCVAHNDLKAAFEEVKHQISFLLAKNYDVKGELIPITSVEEIEGWLDGAAKGVTKHIRPVPTAVIEYLEPAA